MPNTLKELQNQIDELNSQLSDPTITPEKRKILESALNRIQQQMSTSRPDTVSDELNDSSRIMQEQEPTQLSQPETNTNALQTPPPLSETPLQQPATTEEDEESDTEETDTPLSTPMPSPVPAKPSVEDDFESAFNKYKTDTEQIRAEQSQYDTGLEEAESRSQMATGIAGALQAFGEGLAAITGGSAKPLQTGAEALRKSAQQGVESAKRKAGSLKERIMMAREPLETKSEEMKLRDAIEQRQKQKRLADPNSSESAAAQERAKQLFTLYASHAADKGSTGLEEQIRNIIPKLNQFSANDILDLNKQMQSLSSSSKENVQENQERKEKLQNIKNEAQSKNINIKYQQALELANIKDNNRVISVATKDFLAAKKDIADTLKNTIAVRDKMGKFIEKLNLAINGNKDAQQYIAESKDVLNYLTARNYESKGVFTDGDLQALGELTNNGGLTWIQVMENWASKGFTGTESQDQLKKFQRILNDRSKDFDQPEKAIRARYAETFRNIAEISGKPIYSEYANKLENGESTTTAPSNVQPAPAATEPTLKEVTTSELSDIKNAMDKNAIQDGETFIIKTSTGFKKVKRKGDSYEVVSDVK